jgi:hypothetical protein
MPVFDKPKFENPPGAHSQRGKWDRVLQEVKKRPNKWAKIATLDSEKQAHGAINNLRTAANKNGKRGVARKTPVKIPPGRWEFAQDKRDIYARAIVARKKKTTAKKVPV